jgi:hypothetical protein
MGSLIAHLKCRVIDNLKPLLLRYSLHTISVLDPSLARKWTIYTRSLRIPSEWKSITDSAFLMISGLSQPGFPPNPFAKFTSLAELPLENRSELSQIEYRLFIECSSSAHWGYGLRPAWGLRVTLWIRIWDQLAPQIDRIASARSQTFANSWFCRGYITWPSQNRPSKVNVPVSREITTDRNWLGSLSSRWGARNDTKRNRNSSLLLGGIIAKHSLQMRIFVIGDRNSLKCTEPTLNIYFWWRCHRSR